MKNLISKETAWKAIKGELTIDEIDDLQGKYPEPDDYYNYDLIHLQIKRYFDGEIDPKYLAYWANVYSWAIIGSYKYSKVKTKILFEIQDCLDGLSFIDSEPNKKDTKASVIQFKSRFKELQEELVAYYQKKGYTTKQFLRKKGMRTRLNS